MDTVSWSIANILAWNALKWSKLAPHWPEIVKLDWNSAIEISIEISQVITIVSMTLAAFHPISFGGDLGVIWGGDRRVTGGWMENGVEKFTWIQTLRPEAELGR